MSLIQEALRRQNEEGGGDEPGPSPTAAPGAMPPVDLGAPAPAKAAGKLTLKSAHNEPLDGQDSQEEDTSPALPEQLMLGAKTGDADKAALLRKIQFAVLGVLVLVGCCVGGWLVFKQKRVAAVEHEAQSDADLAAAMAVKAAPDSQPVVQVAPVIPPPVEVPTNVADQATDTTNPPEEPVVVTVTWPSLTLSGTVEKGAHSSAFINKQFVKVGDLIEGVKVTAITQDSVTLEFQGEHQIVQVGGTSH